MKIKLLSIEFIVVYILAALLMASYIYAVTSRTMLGLGLTIFMLIFIFIVCTPRFNIFEWKIWKKLNKK